MLDKLKIWVYSKDMTFWLTVDLICWAIAVSVIAFFVY
jgi:hypothetical protein